MDPTPHQPPVEAPGERYRSGQIVAGRYVLDRKLGEGGMGVVWVARSKALDIDVALKLLRGALAGTDAVERMAREARAAAQLGHPALVRVLDFGETEHGEPFMAMELLQGDELATLLQREHRISAVRAVGLLLPIVDGLATAHEKGIVHRDIKPENVFIARDDKGRLQPKLLDFGIAKLGRGEPISRLTQHGAVLGSPAYLSPEQAEGMDDVDFRADIWSIGVMLYEMITGEPPFTGSNYNALIRSITRDAPKPTTEHKAGDPQLWVTIARCLRKEPTERWGSMWELGEALALWLFEQGVRVDASSRSLRDGWLDGSITGVRVIVASAFPGADAATLPPSTPEHVVPPPPADGGRVPTDSNRVDTISERALARGRSRMEGALVAIVVLGVVAALGLFVTHRGPAVGAEGDHSGGPARAAAGPKDPAALPVPVPEVMPPPAEPVPLPPAPSVVPVLSAKLVPKATPSAAGSPGAPPAARAVSAPGRPVRRPRSTVDTEFGF